MLIGIGCAVNWWAVSRYLTHSRQYSVITRTLAEAIPMNLKVMFGILPIYVGYVLMAMSIFWNDRRFFNSFSDTMYTFFAMMNGDSILTTF